MNNSQKKAFLEAVRKHDHKSLVTYLRKGMNANFSLANESPLATAIRQHGDEGIATLQFLLEIAMANPGFMADGEFTPIEIAIVKRNTIAIEMLLDAECDIEQCSTTQRLTPLMVAAKEGNLAAIRLIIDKRENLLINRADVDGNTALHHVCMKPVLTDDDYQIIEILKSIGADPLMPNKDKRSPLDIRNLIENPIRDGEFRVSGFLVPKYPYIG